MPETFHSSEQVKVFILYLLEKIGYPLEYNDLATIVLRDGFVDYFDFVKNFHELLERGHICAVDAGDTPSADDTREEQAEAPVRVEQAEEQVLRFSEPTVVNDDIFAFDAPPDPLPIRENGGEQEEIPDPDGTPDEPPVEDAGEEKPEAPAEEDPDAAGQTGQTEEAEKSDEANSAGSAYPKPAAYVVTATGRTLARGLADDLLLAAVREKSYISAMRHLSLEKRKAVWNHSIEQDGEDYIFHCSISDCDGMAFKLDLRADSFTQADRMRRNFEDKPDVVLRGIVAMVTGNVNYLFEK